MPSTLIGRAENITLAGLSSAQIPAKVDTGADVSSIWASNIEVVGDDLHFKLFSPESTLYTGETVVIPSGEYRITRIANSFGHKELRYVVKLSVIIKGRRVKASFSLSDRSNKLYPVLLGRRLLKGKFVVDVSEGDALVAEEKKRRDFLQKELGNLKERN